MKCGVSTKWRSAAYQSAKAEENINIGVMAAWQRRWLMAAAAAKAKANSLKAGGKAAKLAASAKWRKWRMAKIMNQNGENENNNEKRRSKRPMAISKINMSIAWRQ